MKKWIDWRAKKRSVRAKKGIHLVKPRVKGIIWEKG
jgi:hypothetical protein